MPTFGNASSYKEKATAWVQECTVEKPFHARDRW